MLFVLKTWEPSLFLMGFGLCFQAVYFSIWIGIAARISDSDYQLSLTVCGLWLGELLFIFIIFYPQGLISLFSIASFFDFFGR